MTDRLWRYPLDAGTIGVTFDGASRPIFPGTLWEGIVPYPFHLLKVRMIADTTGNFRVNVKTQPFSTFTPAGYVDIHSSAPNMVAATSYEDTDLVGFTTSFDSHTCIRFVADNVVNVNRVTVVLDVLRG